MMRSFRNLQKKPIIANPILIPNLHNNTINYQINHTSRNPQLNQRQYLVMLAMQNFEINDKKYNEDDEFYCMET